MAEELIPSCKTWHSDFVQYNCQKYKTLNKSLVTWIKTHACSNLSTNFLTPELVPDA